jgi:CRISPR-associated protein Csy1
VRRGRIGLLSSHWRTSTVGSYFSGWIDWLRDAGFEVVVYQLGPQRDATTDALAARATRFRFLEASLEDVARQLRDDALDLLLYPEIGMDARMTPLAALRLARAQAVAWGHPVTSGCATIDHYLSCADMEPPDGATHYVEALHALPGLGVDYRRPARPPELAPAALGLDPARPRVLVPQSLFKLHPDGDAVMATIAAQVPRVQFVLFAGEHPRWWARYVERLRPVFARVGRDVDAHLVQLPLGTRERFLQVNLGCDVMLDSLHWSGGNTAIDALSCGLPLVTCPGSQMRGRQSLAMLRRLGLEEALVTATPEAQAERLVALLRDRDERRGLGRTIEARLPQLFESDAARRSLVEWAAKVVV